MAFTSEMILRISPSERMYMQEVVIDNNKAEAVEIIKEFLKRLEKPERQAMRTNIKRGGNQ